VLIKYLQEKCNAQVITVTVDVGQQEDIQWGSKHINDKFVLAYSGGLDTSVLIKYLQEKCNAQVITVTVDVGQQEDIQAAEEKAKKLGVIKHFSIDAKDEFAKEYIFPAIKANALYEGKYPISTSLSRPLIAKLRKKPKNLAPSNISQSTPKMSSPKNTFSQQSKPTRSTKANTPLAQAYPDH